VAAAKIAAVYDEILYEVTDPVAVVTMNRPADPAVVGIVLTGAGRAFCAGADMRVLAGLSSSDPSEADVAASGPVPTWVPPSATRSS
jgi:enoyl-CoA hydratase/carnithine racemase